MDDAAASHALRDGPPPAGVSLPATKSKDDLILFLMKILSQIDVSRQIRKKLIMQNEKEEKEEKEEEKEEEAVHFVFGDHLDRLTYLAYISESPLVLPQHEQDRYQLMKALFPSLEDVLTPVNYMRLLSIINLNSMAITIHTPALKLTGEITEIEQNAELDKQQKTPNKQIEQTEQQENENDLRVDEDASTGVEITLKSNPNKVIRGSALFKLASYLNHSCEPNVAPAYPNYGTNKIPFVALRDIARGEELLLRYDVMTDDLNLRRKRLQDEYHFWCHCTRCERELANTWKRIYV